MNEHMTEDEYRKILMDMGPSPKSLSDMRSLMATGVGGAPTLEDEMEPTSLSDADDPTKLRRLAEWFDSRESDPEAETEVQDDLRRMARRMDEFVAPTAELEDALHMVYEKLVANDMMTDEQERALEVISGWLSER